MSNLIALLQGLGDATETKGPYWMDADMEGEPTHWLDARMPGEEG